MTKATLVVTPRERFSVAVASLKSIFSDTTTDFDLIYVDGGSPRRVAEELKSLCSQHGARYVRTEHFLSPNRARNIGQRLAQTEYVVFIDNDVFVSPGWLEELIGCADETNGDVVAPLTCQKDPLHSEIHQAGGKISEDLERLLNGPSNERRISDIHLHQGEKVSDTPLKRQHVQCCEFHCVLVRRDAFARHGDLDESLLATKEHLDFSMTVWKNGGEVWFEPKSVVTYLFPTSKSPVRFADMAFFALRWSPAWQRDSLKHFQKKWELFEDPYFTARDKKLDWRLREGVVKPILRSVPVIGKIRAWQRVGSAVMLPLARAWSSRLAKSYAASISESDLVGSDRNDPVDAPGRAVL